MSRKPPFEEMSGLDRLVHDPSRLAILTALSGCRAADFLFLQSLIGMTKGNLSGHLIKLEQGGLVKIVKTFKGKIPRTVLALTPAGRDAIKRHWKRLEQLRRAAAKWGPASDPSPAVGSRRALTPVQRGTPVSYLRASFFQLSQRRQAGHAGIRRCENALTAATSRCGTGGSGCG